MRTCVPWKIDDKRKKKNEVTWNEWKINDNNKEKHVPKWHFFKEKKNHSLSLLAKLMISDWCTSVNKPKNRQGILQINYAMS